MIIAENLKKNYGRVNAIEDVSFKVEEGEILGFLGPNGAGKTTSMRILTGYTPPTSGRALIGGKDVSKHPLEVRNMIGYLPENTPLYLDMDVESYLGFVSEVKGVSPGDRGTQIKDAMLETGITAVSHRTIGKLSKGFRQRVGLAQALIGNPQVLILDEPTVGLDPTQIREIRELIKNMAGKRTVILSTHILPEVSMICERVIIINKGKIIAADAVGELSQRLSETREMRMVVRANQNDINHHFNSVEGLKSMEVVEMGGGDGLSQVTIQSDANVDLRPRLTQICVHNNWDVFEVRSLEPTLEEIFVDIIAREKEEVASV